jgi:hypothetical protein
MPLKAFLVTDDYEGHSSIEFALHNVVARRTGAAALDTEFDAVSCKRAPQFDQYAPGPVPRTALLDDGWWFECSNCYRRAEQRDWDDEDDYRPMVPCVDAADRSTAVRHAVPNTLHASELAKRRPQPSANSSTPVFLQPGSPTPMSSAIGWRRLRRAKA